MIQTMKQVKMTTVIVIRLIVIVIDMSHQIMISGWQQLSQNILNLSILICYFQGQCMSCHGSNFCINNKPGENDSIQIYEYGYHSNQIFKFMNIVIIPAECYCIDNKQ